MSKPFSSQNELPPDPPDGEHSTATKDAWDELAELAAMTGYKADPPPGKKVIAKDISLLDKEDTEALEEDEKTKTP